MADKNVTAPAAAPEKVEKRKTGVAASLPEDTFEAFEEYRWENRLTKSQALVSLINKGLTVKD